MYTALQSEKAVSAFGLARQYRCTTPVHDRIVIISLIFPERKDLVGYIW